MEKEKSFIAWLYDATTNGPIPKMVLSNRTREKLLQYHYARSHDGKELNLKNPQTFTEKIAWYKIFYDNKNFEKYLCKIKFKDFVKEKLGEGHTAKLYGAWTNVDDIDWDSLPKSFVLKSNCSSFGRNIIFVEDKDKLDKEKAKKDMVRWLDYRVEAVNSFSRGYYYVTPQIFAEELIGEIREQPVDYKMFCFDGVPTYCYSAFDHFDNGIAQSSKIAIYDMDWNVLPVLYKRSQCVPVEKPKHFEEMKKAAEILSAEFPFVRVDFYDLEDRIYIGELTFYSGGLDCCFTPEQFNYEMGKHFVLPKKSKTHRIFNTKLQRTI